MTGYGPGSRDPGRREREIQSAGLASALPLSLREALVTFVVALRRIQGNLLQIIRLPLPAGVLSQVVPVKVAIPGKTTTRVF